MTQPEDIGVGPTEALSLRVSAAALARVVFDHPETQTRVLALEHKATLAATDQDTHVVVSAQPFGGAVRLLNTDRFASLVGEFHFDSARARAVRDFRVYVRPESLKAVHRYLGADGSLPPWDDLETDPVRELQEEFEQVLGYLPDPGFARLQPVKILLESGPAPTSNYFAAGAPTVRIYWVYEAVVENLELRRALVALSHSHPVEVLERLALEQYRSGRRGWASSVAVMALGEVVEAFRSLPPGERAKPLPFRQTTLAGNVAAVLDDVDDPRYQRIG